MTQLTDKFFLWPYDDGLAEAIEELSLVFSKSALAEYCMAGTAGNLIEFIALICRQWNVNPWWLVVSGQREQSIFGKPDLPYSAKVAWLGYVGQDSGRRALPGYYGVYAQVERCVVQTAWLLGIHPRIAWPDYVRAGKSTYRYEPNIKYPYPVEQSRLEGNVIVHGPSKEMRASSAAEYVQLAYTPHLHVLEVNQRCLEAWVPSHRRAV